MVERCPERPRSTFCFIFFRSSDYGGRLGSQSNTILRIESPVEPTIALLGVGHEVDVLDVAEDPVRLAVLHLDRKDCLTTLPRLHQLRETPFGGQPTGRQQGNHRLGLAQLLIERLLPAAATFDPRLRVEIEEQRSMALCFQPGPSSPPPPRCPRCCD